jgi:hypothetical protein
MQIRRTLIVLVIVSLLALFALAAIASAQNPLYVGPGGVQRMAIWNAVQVKWLPLMLAGVGVTPPLYTGPGDVARLAYWTGTEWKEWNGTVPAGWLTGTPWTVFYVNGAGTITQLPLGGAGTVLTSNGAAVAPTFAVAAGGTNADTLDHTMHYQPITGVGERLEAGSTNVTLGDSAAITGGGTDTIFASGDWGFIGAGQQNKLYMRHGGIVSGLQNVDSAIGGFIGAGLQNKNLGTYSSIVGGSSNLIGSSMGSGFIGGGSLNKLYSNGGNGYGVIGGGSANKDSSDYSFIGSGSSNWNYRDYSFVGGGSVNKDSNMYGIIVGGSLNRALGDSHNIVVGGHRDSAGSGSFNTVINGSNNWIRGFALTGANSGLYNFIGGGNGNYMSRTAANDLTHNFIGTGTANYIDDHGNQAVNISYNFIGSGNGNSMRNESNSFIGSGAALEIENPTNGKSGIYHVIVGGNKNAIKSDEASDASFIGGGDSNLDSASRAVIVGGANNTINRKAYYSFIGGGDSNSIFDSTGTIVGGFMNSLVANSDYGFMGAGYANKDSSRYGVVIGGRQNYALGDSFNVVVGGFRDSIGAGTRWSFIGGGQRNYIVGGRENVIVGGNANYMNGSANYSFIGGGLANYISNATNYSFIGSGNSNNISSGNRQFIGGGYLCAINGSASDYNTVVGGYGNSIGAGTYSFVGGGRLNIATGNSYSSTISGGYSNIDSAYYATISGTIPGGDSNEVRDSAGYAAGKLAIAKHARSVEFNLTNTPDSTNEKGQFRVNAPGGLENRAVGGWIYGDTVFGYTNSQWTVPSFGMVFGGAGATDTTKIWSGDSMYIGTVYINIKTPGTIAGGDTFWIVNKAKTDSSARCFVPFGTKFAAFAVNKAFGRDTLCMVTKMGGTTVGMKDYVINANYGLVKGRAW